MTPVSQPAGGSIDELAFDQLVEPHRRALLVHCYRMLGSLQDAEDALQEALLRAWTGHARFAARSSLRTWLYRIATNTCLDEIARRPRRPVTIEPFPDALLAGIPDPIADPAALHAANEGLELAFLAALQVLPGRQRAVLVLRDVLGWRSAEVAELLELTPTAVNSALQRARETIAARAPAPAVLPVRAHRSRELVRRCVDAWNRADIDALVALLQEDAVLRMPPQASVTGAAAIGRFFDRLPDGGSFREMQVVASVANGRPALVMRRLEHGVSLPHGVLVLELGETQVAALDASISAHLAARFLDTLDERT
jgi:RNA polymerase sigma-70 factor (ECF subfamily)